RRRGGDNHHSDPTATTKPTTATAATTATTTATAAAATTGAATATDASGTSYTRTSGHHPGLDWLALFALASAQEGCQSITIGQTLGNHFLWRTPGERGMSVPRLARSTGRLTSPARQEFDAARWFLGPPKAIPRLNSGYGLF